MVGFGALLVILGVGSLLLPMFDIQFQIMSLLDEHRLIVTVEEAYLAGGFGSAVMELLEAKGVQDTVKVVRMGVPDKIVTHGDPRLLLAKYGLDADGIHAKALQSITALGERKAEPKRLRVVR